MPAGKGSAGSSAAARRRARSQRRPTMSDYYKGSARDKLEQQETQRVFETRARRDAPLGTGSTSQEDNLAFYLRTLAELQGRGAGATAGGGGGGGRGYGGGGGGGGGGANQAAAYKALLGGLDKSNALVNQLFSQQEGKLNTFADAARRRAALENKTLGQQIAIQNRMTEQALAQRAAALQAILGQSDQTRNAFDEIARTDLGAQGINLGGYNAAAGIEANRQRALNETQRLHATDLDVIARQGNAQRGAYAAQSQRDALSNITGTQQSLAATIAQQRTAAMIEAARERAKLQAEAAAAGVTL